MADDSPSPFWLPPGLPPGAKIFPLIPNKKYATGGRGHLDAMFPEQAMLIPGPNASYGVVLDRGSGFILCDLDVDGQQALVGEMLKVTWAQKTRRGVHFLFKAPDGWTGGRNCYWIVDDKRVGDIKCHGYCVGPESTVDDYVYHRLNDLDPAPAPQWVLDALTSAEAVEPSTEYERIPAGQRDTMMTKLAGSMRRQNYGEDAIRAMLWAIATSGVVEQPLVDPWTVKDAARIAKSAVNWQPEIEIGRISPGLSADDINLVGANMEWLMEDFVPRGQLVTFYGDGGCGKSTWGSWLAAEVTKAGGLFVFAGIEEPFQLFARRACAGGAVRSRLVPLKDPIKIVFPDAADELEEFLGKFEAACLWLDAIYTHFDSKDTRNAAERARTVMGCLAEIAQRTRTTIMCGTHENKAGEYLGSVEMKNVARCLLHARRNEGEPMTLLVEKSNFRKPKTVATFIGREVLARDDVLELTQYEIRGGQKVPVMDVIAERGPDNPVGKKGKGKTEKVTEPSIQLAQIDDNV
jgi:hypothetical protein